MVVLYLNLQLKLNNKSKKTLYLSEHVVAYYFCKLFSLKVYKYIIECIVEFIKLLVRIRGGVNIWNNLQKSQVSVLK